MPLGSHCKSHLPLSSGYLLLDKPLPVLNQWKFVVKILSIQK